MRMKPFGNTGISVSEYGIGTWAMGGGVYGIAVTTNPCAPSTVPRNSE